jgi:hypothetical protein
MSDNVVVDNVALPDYTVSSDEAASGQVQRVKLSYSADGSDTHITANANGLQVQGLVSLANSVINVSQADSLVVVGNISTGTSDTGNPVKVGGVFVTVPPVLATGQRGNLQLDSSGNLRVAIKSGTLQANVSQPSDVVGDANGLYTTSQTELWDAYGANWTRARIIASDGMSGTGLLATNLAMWDSVNASYVRSTGNTANGLDVDVTRVTGTVQVSLASQGASAINVSQAGSFSVLAGTNPWNVAIACYGGSTTSLGQKTGAASIPMVLPSDQTVNINNASWGGSTTSLGQKTAANSVPAVLASDSTVQVSLASQGVSVVNVNMASYGGAQTTLGQKAAASSAPVVLASDATVQVNLASQGSSSVTISGTVIANQGTSAATSNAWPIKPTRDIARTPVTIFGDELSTATSETLFSLSATKAGLSQATSTTYIVSAGKILRLTSLAVECKALAATMSQTKVRVRQGATTLSSVLATLQVSPPAATVNVVGTVVLPIPEGAIELGASTSLAMSHVASALSSNATSFCLVGYEYTP